MKVLHLTLKKKWFDMIASGEKKEEYREVTEYWQVRLMEWEYRERNNIAPYKEFLAIQKFDAIRFTNGYSKDAPRFLIECLGIDFGRGNPDWGAEPGKEYFVIKLGKIINQ